MLGSTTMGRKGETGETAALDKKLLRRLSKKKHKMKKTTSTDG